MSETRDELERVIGARAVGTVEIDGRDVPLAFATNELEVVELLRLAALNRWRVMPIGSGTKLDRGPVRDKPRFALSLRGHSGVTAYERGDGTITARAGSTMAALDRVARDGGNHLTPDVANATQATLGGTLGSGLSGVDRLRYGPLRHHVLGMRVALADGSCTKTGGRLVKNVTGYDLHRLYTGSRGSLCVILEASLRLFPAPEIELALVSTFYGRAAALAAAESVLAGPLKPTCVCVAGPADGQWALTIGLAGRPEPLASERSICVALIGECVVHEGREARAGLEALRDAESATTLRIGTLRGGIERVLATLDVQCHLLGLDARLAIQPGIAYVDATLARSDAVESFPADLLSLARTLSSIECEVECIRAPLATRAAFDPLEHSPAAVRALMGRLKVALDPEQTFVGTRAPLDA